MAMTPPPSNPPVYTKIDDSAFYVTSMATTQIDVVALADATATVAEIMGRALDESDVLNIRAEAG